MLKSRSTFSLAATVALLTVIVSSQPFSRSMVMAAPATFEVPATVPSDTSLKVSSGSDAMTLISDALKTNFESEFNGTVVNVDAVGAAQAVQALINGNADLAAVSRPLSADEAAQDLTAVDVSRTKIAIIVGEDNPFADSLTTEQFAQIFRGEITDWSDVGGPSGAIRLIDRPDTSDTRLALASYPVFQAAEFATGSSAVQVSADSTQDIAKNLGADGISYALVSEVENVDGVRILPMHKTLPTDPRYPFSQPFSFVFKGEPSPAVAAFLGYATGAPGQAVLKSDNPLAGLVNAAGDAAKGAANLAGNVVDGAVDAAGNVVDGATDVAGNVVDGATNAVDNVADGTASDVVEDATEAAGNVVDGVTDAAGNVIQGATDVAENAVSGAPNTTVGNASEDTVSASANQAAAESQSDRNPQSTSRGNLWWLMIVPAACFGLVAWGARRKNKPVYAVDQGSNVTLSGVEQAAAGTVATARTVSKKTGNAAKAGFTNVGNATKSGLGNVKSGFDSVGDATKGGLGNVKGAAQRGVDGIKGDLGRVSGSVRRGAGRVGDGVKGGLDNTGNTVREGADAVTDKLGNMADDAGHVIKGGAAGSESLWNRVRDGVSDTADAVADKTDNMANQAKWQAGNLKNQAGQLGKEGLKRTSDMADKLKDLDS